MTPQKRSKKRRRKDVNACFGHMLFDLPVELIIELAVPLFETINLTRKVARNIVSLLSTEAKYSLTVSFHIFKNMG